MLPRWMCQRRTTWAGELPDRVGDLGDHRIVEDGALGDRRPRLGRDAVRLAVRADLVVEEVGVELDLVDRRHVVALGREALEMVDLEVRDADRARAAVALELLERLPGRDEVAVVERRQRPVDEEQVDVVEAERRQRRVERPAASSGRWNALLSLLVTKTSPRSSPEAGRGIVAGPLSMSIHATPRCRCGAYDLRGGAQPTSASAPPSLTAGPRSSTRSPSGDKVAMRKLFRGTQQALFQETEPTSATRGRDACHRHRPRAQTIRSSSTGTASTGLACSPSSGRRPSRTPGMATSEATIVEAGGRDLRVSSPDRVIFPATERTAAVTKLDVVKYYLAVEDGIMRALERRPTTLERWPKGVHPGIVLSTREKGGGDAFFQKRIPRGAPDYVRDRADPVPVGPPRGRDLPDRDRRRRLGGADGHDHVPSVAGARATTSTIRTSCASTSTRSRAPTSPTPCASPPRRACCWTSSATPASRRPRAAAASTSTSGSSRAGRSPTSATPRSRSGASSSGACPGQVTTKWWKEERGERIFVDYNQNARDRTIASAYSVRPKPGAPVSAPVTWDELADVAPEDFTVATMPARFAEVGDRHAAIDDVAHSLQPLLDMYESDEARDGRHALPARLPEDAGRAEARAALARPRPPARRDATAPAAASSRRAWSPAREGGGTTGPMSPSGASSRSTITGA